MISENEIVEILNQKGILRFSTLMVRYHLSANAAMRIVEEYKKKGVIDGNCRPTFERKLKWNPDGEDLGEDEKGLEKPTAKRNTAKKRVNVSPQKAQKKKRKFLVKKLMQQPKIILLLKLLQKRQHLLQKNLLSQKKTLLKE